MTRAGGKDRGLFERPADSGIWWIRYHDEHGREHREKIGPKKLALSIYHQRKAQIIERRFNPDSIRRKEIAVGDFIRLHLSQQKSKRSYVDMARIAKRWIEFFGDRGLRHVRPADIDRYRAARLEDEIADQTLYHELSFLRRVFNVAAVEGLVEGNPVRKLKAPKGHRVRFLTEDEEQRLMALLAPCWHPHVQIALHTGMRSGEQFGLKWSQVDLRNGIVSLPRTKSGDPRTVELNESAKAAFRTLPRVLRCELAFVALQNGRPMRGGKRLNVRNFYRRVFSMAIAEAGIKDFVWHDLRHTFASRLVMEGVEIPTVQALLGHKSITMTMRYAHLAPGRRTRAVALLNGYADRAVEPTGTRTGTGPSSEGKK